MHKRKEAEVKTKMSLKKIEEIVEKFDGKLTDEEAFYLWERWRRFVRYNAVKEWQESAWPFLEHAVSSGFHLGKSVLRRDCRLPYSPENCYFGRGKRDNKPQMDGCGSKDSKTEYQRMAEQWNKAVYEPNRALVQSYKRRHGIHEEQEPSASDQPEETSGCKWCCNEVCVNPLCPVRADFCPVVDYPGVCMFEEEAAAQGPV